MELLGIGPGRLVGDALGMLLEARLDEGPLGEEEAERRLRAWWAPRGEGGAGPGALVVQDLVQRVQDLDQVRLVGHDLVDVLVGRGDLVHQRVGLLVDSHTLPAICSARSAVVKSFLAWVRLCRRPAPCEHDIQLAGVALAGTM